MEYVDRNYFQKLKTSLSMPLTDRAVAFDPAVRPSSGFVNTLFSALPHFSLLHLNKIKSVTDISSLRSSCRNYSNNVLVMLNIVNRFDDVQHDKYITTEL